MSILLVYCEHQASKVGELMVVSSTGGQIILVMSLLSRENDFTSINDFLLRRCDLRSFAWGLFHFFNLWLR